MNSVSNRVDINQVLMQMRELKQAAQQQGIDPLQSARVDGVNNPERIDPASSTEKQGFSDLLKGAIDSVNETQQKAGELAYAFETGDQNVDITQVMIQLQKASVSFEAMTQVRNKLVTAYQDIMNMPI